MTHFHIAVVQTSPVLFDLQATIEKIEQKVREAKSQGAELVMFPEAFIPAYPRGLSFGTVVGSRDDQGRKQWLRYWKNSMEIPGEAFRQICQIAENHQVYLVLGVTERAKRGGTLYCTLMYVGPEGKLIGKHRKIKPTAAERYIWGEGAGNDLDVYETPWGKIGGLICWENYMPEARMELYRKGVEFYFAPTADQRDSWQATMVHIACEGRCYVMGCNQYVTPDMYPREILDWETHLDRDKLSSRGGSVILSPLGKILAGPLWDQEGILYATLDREEVIQSKLDFDVIGHYSRGDIFDLKH